EICALPRENAGPHPIRAGGGLFLLVVESISAVAQGGSAGRLRLGQGRTVDRLFQPVREIHLFFHLYCQLTAMLRLNRRLYDAGHALRVCVSCRDAARFTASAGRGRRKGGSRKW